MRYLIDTNIMVYTFYESNCISNDVKAILDDYDNTFYLSVESLKELIVAYRTKNLCSNIWKSEELMVRAILDSCFVIMPLKPEHMLTYSKMTIDKAHNHKDPSDHVIIAQAMTEHIPLISSDRRFPYYRNQGLDLIENLK